MYEWWALVNAVVVSDPG